VRGSLLLRKLQIGQASAEQDRATAEGLADGLPIVVFDAVVKT
jgi:hypothetical protein